MNFAVNDRYLDATIEDMEKGRIMQNMLTSNDPSYVKHFISIFEEMWENAVDASEAIKNIEKGVAAEFQTLDKEEENMKSYLNEVLNEIRETRDSHRWPRQDHPGCNIAIGPQCLTNPEGSNSTPASLFHRMYAATS